MRTLPILAKIYISLIVSLGLCSLALGLWFWRSDSPTRFLVYLAVSLLCSGMKVRLPGIQGNMSVKYQVVDRHVPLNAGQPYFHSRTKQRHGEVDQEACRAVRSPEPKPQGEAAQSQRYDQRNVNLGQNRQRSHRDFTSRVHRAPLLFRGEDLTVIGGLSLIHEGGY